ncbi:hypothetical protein RchiOBHm_Chr6g0270631 [Rosa chinensis]|uniref:Uncharacterized protein n=1 Tax=Rosa chinensis TaxID=74649 RepID=A0A2P6PQT2_ROSCH|nr:hypothetical protein RchiOBHm_Chr6g0270631 [Rosa chinensis]
MAIGRNFHFGINRSFPKEKLTIFIISISGNYKVMAIGRNFHFGINRSFPKEKLTIFIISISGNYSFLSLLSRSHLQNRNNPTDPTRTQSIRPDFSGELRRSPATKLSR